MKENQRKRVSEKPLKPLKPNCYRFNAVQEDSSDKGLKLRIDDLVRWYPRSQITIYRDHDDPDRMVVDIPEWLAKDKGLLNNSTNGKDD